MSEFIWCEICGDAADSSCQNCGDYVCGGCATFIRWGPSDEEILVCDNCSGVLDDYADMDFDEFSEPDPGTLVLVDAPVEDVSLACSRCGRLESFQILWDERDDLKEYEERLPYVCSDCSPTGNDAWFDGFSVALGIE